MISKDKEILAAEEKLKRKKRAYSDLAKRLKYNEALSTKAMKKLSEKQKSFKSKLSRQKKKKRRARKI